QRVDQKTDVEGEVAAGQVPAEAHAHAAICPAEAEERQQRQHEAARDGEAGDDAGQWLFQGAAEQAVDERARQRQQWRQGGEGHDALVHARTSDSSSTSVLTRLRKMATRIPSPTATSAAAIASTMNTAVWPVNACGAPASAHCRANATMLGLAALSSNSTDRKIMMALRRVRTPTVPSANSTALRTR